MLGYITEKEALKMGFTHHGKCFGIPIWITDEEAPMVATKFVPFEFLLTVEQTIHAIFWPGSEPVFQFLIGKEIGK